MPIVSVDPPLRSIARAALRFHIPGVWLAILAVCMCGCSTVKFYAQAANGQAEILNKARPIKRIIADPKTSERVRRKLKLVQELRQYAKEHLELPADRQYGRYSDLDRRYVVWIVYAAPEFSVEGKTWSYPLVGTLEYRGFFSKKMADEEAAMLKAAGYEVFSGGVEAYSTLGWFRDPVLNTFLYRSDSELAELIFHELTHVKLFLPGDTDFNEAFATANAEAGVRRWLRSKGDSRALAQYDKALTRERQMVQLLLGTREKLKQLYARASLSPEEMRREKEAIIASMRREYADIRRRWGVSARRDRSFARPWTNARLNTVATYYDLVPGFEGLLKEKGGDLNAFYAAVEGMRHLSPEQRKAALKRESSPR
jgi:predicted aminopeptidase